MPKISVVMPAYNVKEYISTSIESVLNQKFKDFEFIIINDGSTDGTAEIINEYSLKDQRIKPLHIENNGVSNARNLGLLKSSADYIAFIDSDDIVQDDYLEILYKNMIENDSDITISSFYKYNEADNNYQFIMTEESPNELVSFNYADILSNLYSRKNGYYIILNVLWGKLIKRSLFENICFPNGKVYEDSFIMYKLYLIASNIVYVNCACYMYRVRRESIMTSTMSEDKIKNRIEFYEEQITLFAIQGISLSNECVDDYIYTLRNLRNITLQNGFIDLHKSIDMKLSFIETYRNLYIK